MKRASADIWTSHNRTRYFLIPDHCRMVDGDLVITNRTGGWRAVSADALAPFEVTEEQARRWAKDQLGQALSEIRGSIDEKLGDWRRQLDEFNRSPVAEEATVTPNAVPALFDFLKKLPSVLGNSLSGEEKRVESAKTAMADLQRQLKEAGIDLDDRFTNFPDRLADLRKDYEEQRASKKSNSDGTTSDQR